MIFLFIFLGLFFGLALIGNNLIIFILLSISTLIFIIIRFNKRILFSYLISFTVGVGISLISFNFNPLTGEYLGFVIDSRENYYVVLVKFEKLIVYESNNIREIGDIVKINGSISNLVDNSLESDFSFVNYLAEKGILREIKINNINVEFKNFIQLKAFKNYFLNLFDNNARDYVDMFLFNNKNYQNSSVFMMSQLNLNYLFSSSGIYLSLIIKIIEYFLYLKFDKKKTKLFSLILLSWYFVFAFNRVGIRRILYVRIFSYINSYHLKNKYNHLEVVSLVGIFMLSLNPYLAKQSSFYLGIFLSISFYFVSNALTKGRRSLANLKTTLFAFLFMLPVSLFSSNEFHIFSLLFQIVLTPYTFIFMLFSLISFYTYPIRSLFNFLSDNVLTNLLKGFKIIDIKIPFKEFTSLYVFLYYLLLFGVIYFMESSEKKKCYTISTTILLLFAFKITPYENLYANSITFLNVGQGDSAIIRNKRDVIMIDTGGLTYKDIATSVTIPYLNKKGINKIDYVFISHSDNDHCGALDSLKNNFKVVNVVDTNKPFKITINDLVIENINKWADLYDDQNDKSQVLKFRIANRNVLMMGDASFNIENHIMQEYDFSNLNIDLLKIGHHGSKSSSSYEFLKFINPKEAIISVGKNNLYHHPNKEVIDNLNLLNINYHRTDENGSISYYENSFLRA